MSVSLSPGVGGDLMPADKYKSTAAGSIRSGKTTPNRQPAGSDHSSYIGSPPFNDKLITVVMTIFAMIVCYGLYQFYQYDSAVHANHRGYGSFQPLRWYQLWRWSYPFVLRLCWAPVFFGSGVILYMTWYTCWVLRRNGENDYGTHATVGVMGGVVIGIGLILILLFAGVAQVTDGFILNDSTLPTAGAGQSAFPHSWRTYATFIGAILSLFIPILILTRYAHMRNL